MKNFFGTDGVRGIANQELSCELALNLGRASGKVLTQGISKKATFLIGKDPRISSDMLESALTAGLLSVGVNVVSLGVISTPAISVLVNKYDVEAGFMISASHNPSEYNGIKIFNKDGYKLPDELELQIEKQLMSKQYDLVSSANLGRVTFKDDAVKDYIAHIKAEIGGCDFSKFKIAIDCANGASSVSAERLFKSFGARCLMINDIPDGLNINQNCGSTHMETISEFVVKNRCDIGFAFDGDADRCLVVDKSGSIIDGDKIIAIIAKYLKSKGQLVKDTFVVTVMSNLGLIKMAQENNMRVERTKVGDRYVLEKMRESGYSVGGEASGHIILLDHSTTGDGQLVAAYLLKIIKELDIDLSQLSKIITTFPQILVNIEVENSKKKAILDDQEIIEMVKSYEEELGEQGRILIRASGTEPLIRVMVEGESQAQIKKISADISKIIKIKKERLVMKQ